MNKIKANCNLLHNYEIQNDLTLMYHTVKQIPLFAVGNIRITGIKQG